jgi:threonine/homoserine/homoserine lactone efflux protein
VTRSIWHANLAERWNDLELDLALDSRLAEFALASLLIELTPGPNMAWLAALALAEGRRTGLMAVAGVALGLAAVGVLAALGLAAALDRIPYAYETLRYAGALFLLWLAWEGWRGAGGEEASMGARGAFARALMQNLLNPKAALFYIAVMPLFLPAAGESRSQQSLALVAIYVAVATAVHAAIVLFAGALRPYLVEGPQERFVRRALALSLVGVALWFFLKSAR